MMRKLVGWGVLSAALALMAATGAVAHDGAVDWQPAGKDCYIVSNSHHGFTPESAREQSQKGLPILIEELRRDFFWSKARMKVTAAKAKPNPSLRSTVPADAFVKPDVKTETSYTQCWTGVIWPYVCSAGAKICKK